MTSLKVIGLILSFIGAFIVCLNSFIKIVPNYCKEKSKSFLSFKIIKRGNYEGDASLSARFIFEFLYDKVRLLIADKFKNDPSKLPEEFNELSNEASSIDVKEISFPDLRELNDNLKDMCKCYYTKKDYQELVDSIEQISKLIDYSATTLIDELIFSYVAKIGFSFITVGFLLQLVDEFIVK